VQDQAAAKAALRSQMRAAIAALPPARRALEEEAVQAAIQDAPEWRSARTVLLYGARPPEFSLVGLTLAAWREGKRTLFPAVVGPRRLALRAAASWTDLRPGHLGIREPRDGPDLPAAEVDLALVPGLAFDERGHRLGRGGAYYDALLPEFSLSWGVAFDCQIARAVPWESHDATVMDVWSCRTKHLFDS